jgi:hypothetical protein
MNYNNYISLGVDSKIKNIQDALNGHLGFTNVDYYGRVQKIISKDGKKIVPSVCISNSEMKEVFYDDTKAPGGNVFFVVSDDDKSKNGILFTSEVKIVFMLNLNKLEISKDKAYRADSEIQHHCISLLKKLKVMNITNLQRGLKNILSEFDTSGIVKNDLQPYHTFSINGEIKYNFNCKN